MWPAPARFPPVGKRPMPAPRPVGMAPPKRMRMQAAQQQRAPLLPQAPVMSAPTSSPLATMSPSATTSAPPSVAANRPQNALALLNRYKPGLNYQVVGDYGPPHSKTFTIEVVVEDQVGGYLLALCCGFFSLSGSAQ